MVIIGAKGMAKELLTVLQWNGEANDLFFFDNINAETPDLLYGRFQVLKSWEILEKHFLKESREFVLGVGGIETRRILAEKATSLGGKLCSVVSKHALVGEFGNKIGNGVSILSHATITVDVTIGEGSLINKAVIISHDARIGKYCEISPGAKILGRATVGDYSVIGTNAIILPDVKVGTHCKVGAGSIVTKDVADHSTVAGFLARLTKGH